MSAILTLVENLKKYAEYLTTTAISMTQHHHKDESTRSPENDCTMYQVFRLILVNTTILKIITSN
jgi:hypothetical protein